MPNERTADHDAARAADRPADRPLAPAAGPTIRELTRAECEAVLRRHVVGRVAFAFERRVEIRPIHFVYEDGWLYGRTTPGDKLDMWRHSRWVAFEVDEVRGLFDWTSVLVHGGLYVVAPDAKGAEAGAWERAVAALRRLVPEAGTPHDPVPERTIVFRIHADDVTGRTATPAPVA